MKANHFSIASQAFEVLTRYEPLIISNEAFSEYEMQNIDGDNELTKLIV